MRFPMGPKYSCIVDSMQIQLMAAHDDKEVNQRLLKEPLDGGVCRENPDLVKLAKQADFLTSGVGTDRSRAPGCRGRPSPPPDGDSSWRSPCRLSRIHGIRIRSRVNEKFNFFIIIGEGLTASLTPDERKSPARHNDFQVDIFQSS